MGPTNLRPRTNQQGQPEKLMLEKEVLAQDYDMAVAGMAGPLDRDNRRSDTLTLYSLLMQNPLIQGEPPTRLVHHADGAGRV